MKNVLWLAPLLLLGAARQEPPARPNVLLIVADDLGWSDVGWHGGFARTPRMDALVKEGVELDRHYVQPVCTPTRTALLSGRYPGRFGPHPLAPSNLRALPAGTPTLASALKAAGYTTSIAGKWHLGSRPEWGPNRYGFDHSYGTMTGAADPWTHKYRKGHPYEDSWHRDGRRLDEEGNATELIAAEAVRRIEEKKGPWLVYVPFHAVHTPVDAPEEFKKPYEGTTFHEDPVNHESRLRMAAMVAQLDAKIGQFVDALERTGQRQNTLIVFTSDNGGIESLKNAYVGKVGHSPLNSENDPLRGQKDTLYEGGVRVCAFANWPGRLAPRKVEAPMHAVDWFPTIAGLAGLAADPAWDGLDRWAVLGGAPAAARTIYIAHKFKGQALLHGSWKLIAPAKGKPELYDLAADPHEKTDLAAAKPDVVEDLSRRLAAERAKDDPRLPEDLRGLPD
jgi:arylsulfatase A-like enzyme